MNVHGNGAMFGDGCLEIWGEVVLLLVDQTHSRICAHPRHPRTHENPQNPRHLP